MSENRTRAGKQRSGQQHKIQTPHWRNNQTDYLCGSRNRMRSNAEWAMLFVPALAEIGMKVCSFFKTCGCEQQDTETCDRAHQAENRS
jgi:hypothetical protein